MMQACGHLASSLQRCNQGLLWLWRASNSKIPSTVRIKPEIPIRMMFSTVWSWGCETGDCGQTGEEQPKPPECNCISTLSSSLLCIQFDLWCPWPNQNFPYSPIVASDMFCGWLVVSGTPEKQGHDQRVKCSRELIVFAKMCFTIP